MAEVHGSGKRPKSLGWPIFLGLMAAGLVVQFVTRLVTEGETHGGHGFVLAENGFYIFDFIVLVVALVWFVRGPLQQFLRQRRAHIEREIDEARRLQAEARQTLETYRDKLANLDAEVEMIRKNAREDAEAVRAKIIADGEAHAKKLLEDAETRVRQESWLLKERLEAEIIAAAAVHAEELVVKGLTPDLQRQYVRDYVDEIARMAAAGKAGRA